MSGANVRFPPIPDVLVRLKANMRQAGLLPFDLMVDPFHQLVVAVPEVGNELLDLRQIQAIRVRDSLLLDGSIAYRRLMRTSSANCDAINPTRGRISAFYPLPTLWPSHEAYLTRSGEL